MKTSQRIILILLFFNIITNAFGLVKPSTHTQFIPQAFDVLHYDATLDLTKAPARDMSGVAKIKILWTDDPKSNNFYFHLRSLNIDSAFYDGVPVSPKVNSSPDSADYHFSISPSSGKTGDTSLLVIYYHGTMTAESETQVFGGVNSRGSCLYSVGVGFHNNYVSATQHWMPCYDHPSDKATFHFKFIVKPGKTVASNGLGTVSYPDNGTDVWDWSSDIPTASYLMCFAVDDYIPIYTGTKTNPVVIYAKRADSAAVEFAFSLSGEMHNAMNSCFGKYPFEKSAYVLVPEIGGAMEHQTMISINDGYIRSLYKAKDNNNTTALHEMAHQWFGDAASVKDFRDAWLSESFATYAEALWAEKHKNYEAYLEQIYLDIYTYINYIAPNEGVLPLYDFPREAPSSNYPSTIYQKGAAVVALLRYELGNKFFDVMKAYLEKYKYSNLSTAEFQAFLEKESGKKLDWFFNQWIYGKGYPVLDIYVDVVYLDVIYDHYRASIRIKQNQPKMFGAYTNIPIPVRYYNAYTGEKVVKILNMTEIEQSFVIDSMNIDYGIDFNSSNKLDSLVVLMKINSLIVNVEEERTNNTSESIILTPNPATDYIEITVPRWRGIKGVDYGVKIYNVFGEELLLSLPGGEGVSSSSQYSILTTQYYRLDVSGFPPGLYFVRVGEKTGKFVKTE